MLKLIDADKKYLDQYKEAYIKSLKQIELGNIKRHDMMFLEPKKMIQYKRLKTIETNQNHLYITFRHMTTLL